MGPHFPQTPVATPPLMLVNYESTIWKKAVYLTFLQK